MTRVLPLKVWLLVAGAVLLLLGLCAGTAYAVLRLSARQRSARWPAGRLLGLVVAAVVPWLVVWLAPIHLGGEIHSVVALLGLLLAALLTFALLVLLPLVTLLCAAVWAVAHRRRAAP